MVVKDSGIDATILHRIIACHDIRRNILAEAASALHHRRLAHTCSRIGNNARREYHSILYDAVAGNLRTISEHAAVANLCVVRHVNAFHKEVVVAYHGLAVAERCTVDNDILAYDVAVSDNKMRRVTLIVEVLRNSSKHSVLEHLVAASQTGTVHYADVRIDDAVVTDLNIAFYISKRIDSNILSDFALGSISALGLIILSILIYVITVIIPAQCHRAVSIGTAPAMT